MALHKHDDEADKRAAVDRDKPVATPAHTADQQSAESINMSHARDDFAKANDQIKDLQATMHRIGQRLGLP